MIFFLVAFGVLLHVLFWGAGLAMLLMPAPWRRFWPVLGAPAGCALQALVVWWGAFANLPGTNSYVGWSELIPLTLLAVALWRHGVRAAWTDVGRFGLVWASVGGCLAVLTLPLALASKGLTTVSLGSCDAADYAAGARVLMEFARPDRTGFLGLTEVVSVQSVDNFFDYWLRVNHFIPSALIAFNGAALNCAPHELTSVMTMVLLAISLPVVFWIVRSGLGYHGAVSTGIALVYGFSPLNWYAVAHVAPAQLLAAQAIALITWSGLALWRGPLTWRLTLQFAGVLVVAYAIILGSYNFILLVCWVPAGTYALGLAAWHGHWRKLAAWVAAMIGPLVIAGGFFAERVAGLGERFVLLKAYDFGWRIPALTPEGWLGMVSGPALDAWTWGGLRWGLSAVIIGGLAAAFARAISKRRTMAWAAASLSLPILAGYIFLEWRGARLGTNASYDAYKLFAVFYPGLLGACCWWVTLRRSGRLFEWFAVVGFAALVFGFNLLGTAMFVIKLSRPTLMVTGELRQLRKVEAMDEVKSINVLLPDMWSRLWANAFLLRKPQYFETHTYEGRLNTPLRGEWDLHGGIVRVQSADAVQKPITPRLVLVQATARPQLKVTFDEGWYQEELTPTTGEIWRWTKGAADLLIENPQNHPVAITCTIDGWSVAPGNYSLAIEGQATGSNAVAIGAERKSAHFSRLLVPPGSSKLKLQSNAPAAHPVEGDPRSLGLCVFKWEINVSGP